VGASDEAGARAALFVEYRRTRDRALRNQIIEANLGLAESLARRYGGRGERSEDLSQVAMLGLVKAVERFEPERGLAFSSFAAPTIEGELKRHFRDKRWAVRMPRRLQELSLEVNQSLGTLAQRFGRSPTLSEVAVETGLSEETVLEALEAGRAASATSLDAPAGGEGAGQWSPAEQLGKGDQELERVEQRLTLASLLEALPERERNIIILRFFDGLAQAEIARRFGISQMQVSRLLARSLERLRGVAGR
jgi:RNA polymerase sigma-B factor